jgi:peptidoglycan/xylan/chitin deacetylase (PgdA/CDA1 family)
MTADGSTALRSLENQSRQPDSDLPQGIIALCYHGIEKKFVKPWVQSVHHRFSDFRRHVAFLKQHATIISVPQLFDLLSRKELIDRFTAVITFDDGYKNNIRCVAPFLVSEEIPFSVFASTHHIETGTRFPTFVIRACFASTQKQSVEFPSLQLTYNLRTEADRIRAAKDLNQRIKRLAQDDVERVVREAEAILGAPEWERVLNLYSSDEPMSWDELCDLHRLGTTIGSHCHRHVILHAGQSRAVIEAELAQSKALIERHVGDCPFFAFPNGGVHDITPQALRQVRANGYQLSFAAVPGLIQPGTSPHALPRIFPAGPLDAFIAQLRAVQSRTAEYRQWRDQLDR